MNHAERRKGNTIVPKSKHDNHLGSFRFGGPSTPRPCFREQIRPGFLDLWIKLIIVEITNQSEKQERPTKWRFWRQSSVLMKIFFTTTMTHLDRETSPNITVDLASLGSVTRPRSLPVAGNRHNRIP